jgi:hypothetical protein
MDGNNTEIRSHSEVCDGTGEQRDREQVMEDPFTALGEVCQADDDEEGERIDGTHSPEPV